MLLSKIGILDLKKSHALMSTVISLSSIINGNWQFRRGNFLTARLDIYKHRQKLYTFRLRNIFINGFKVKVSNSILRKSIWELRNLHRYLLYIILRIRSNSKYPENVQYCRQKNYYSTKDFPSLRIMCQYDIFQIHLHVDINRKITCFFHD